MREVRRKGKEKIEKGCVGVVDWFFIIENLRM